MTVYAITDTKKGRTGIAPTYLQTTREMSWNCQGLSTVWILESGHPVLCVTQFWLIILISKIKIQNVPNLAVKPKNRPGWGIPPRYRYKLCRRWLKDCKLKL